MILSQLFSYKEIREELQRHPLCLIYLGSETCQVCHAVRPAIESIVEHSAGVDGFYASIDQIREAAGQMLVFAVPAVLVYHHGKEIFRSARFIDLEQLHNVLAAETEEFES